MSSNSIRLAALYAIVMAAAFVPHLTLGQQITVQSPSFGVSIDADGVLSTKTYPDPTGRLIAKRIAVARGAQPADLRNWSELRKVSLIGLERALAARLEAGGKPDDAQLHLAGLQRAQYVFFFPEERDIVIAGPAEGWVEDLSGRSVGLTTGRPTLLL